MILILDHRSDAAPIAPSLLSPEPRMRKCSRNDCLRRLGVYIPSDAHPRRQGALRRDSAQVEWRSK